MDETSENRVYVVVVNHEEQYSIWPEGNDVPAGWRALERSGAERRDQPANAARSPSRSS